VPVEWLRQRPLAAEFDRCNALAPCVWKLAQRGQVHRRQLWTSRIRSQTDQLPGPGSADEKVLGEILALTPDEFEKFVVALIDKLPEIVPGLTHRVLRTQMTADYGVDFFGTFTLPRPIAYEIEFVGEAKRYSNPVSPDKVSRLVARLGRGQYGLFFTTSSYSDRAQKEVIMDRYPVRLFSGRDIVDILREGHCVAGDRLRRDWKEAALSAPDIAGVTGLVPFIA